MDIVIAGVVVVLAVWLFKKPKPIAISALDERRVRWVSGTARKHVEPPLVAPFTGRACVCYIAEVEVDYVIDANNTRWRPHIIERRGVPFVLHDATGDAIVDPEGAELVHNFDYERAATESRMDNPTENECAFLDRHGEHELWSKQVLRYRERCIGLDDEIVYLQPGREVQHWLKAENDLIAERNLTRVHGFHNQT